MISSFLHMEEIFCYSCLIFDKLLSFLSFHCTVFVVKRNRISISIPYIVAILCFDSWIIIDDEFRVETLDRNHGWNIQTDGTLCYIVLYYIVLYCIILYCIVLYCTVLYCIHNWIVLYFIIQVLTWFLRLIWTDTCRNKLTWSQSWSSQLNYTVHSVDKIINIFYLSVCARFSMRHAL